MFDETTQESIRDTVSIAIQAAEAAASEDTWQEVKLVHVNFGVTTIFVNVFYQTNWTLEEANASRQNSVFREFIRTMLESYGALRVAIKFDSLQAVERRGGWHLYYK